ncbi:hypothetical protein FSO04_44200 [Paraburkholderia madseniana]|uniref:Uncharacterized protein n=1 Tax=Paraburkholderia madseniana TaxID=2599607 RepID=A0A6N6W1D9_9BURK|nr:hypothetical protein [Paraburkholderia madseniana]KAE8753604.1 hypothetical protein FSO04_44200 [Paraburkholderia madseniana]
MSTSMSVNSATAANQSNTSDTATILQLQKLEKAIGRQFKAAIAEAQKSPRDPQTQLLVAQLSAQFAAVQSDITELEGTSTLNSGKSNLKATQQASRTLDEQRNEEKANEANNINQEDGRTSEVRPKRIRLDLTGTYIDDAV